MTEKTPWSFYLGWAFSGVIGFLIAFPFSWVLDVFVIDEIVGQMILVRGRLHITEDYLGWYVFAPVFGIAIGVLQSLLLRQKLTKVGWWMPLTAFGWSLAWLIFALRRTPLDRIDVPSSGGGSLLMGVVLGGLLGVVQWLILRTKVSHAGWWVPISALGFGAAGILFWGDSDGWFGILAAITIPHLATGIALWWLLEKFRRDLHRGFVV